MKMHRVEENFWSEDGPDEQMFREDAQADSRGDQNGHPESCKDT